MKQQTKQFENKYVRLRNKIERKGIAIFKKALTEQYNYVLSKLSATDFRQWVDLVDTIPEKPIRDAFELYYPLSSSLATMTYKHLKQAKDATEDAVLNSVFSRELTRIVRTECGDKITTITSTSKDKIKNIIREIIDSGETEGIGIPEMTSNIYRAVGANLRGNGYDRARAIAQTEVISASNQASEFAADSTGLDYRKFWSNSGLQGVRPSHIYAQEAHPNGILKHERFDMGNGNFMLYPGDPSGVAEEVINCRCTCLYEIV